MRLIYLAHPYASDPINNLARAKRWYKWIIDNHPDVCVIAPWLTEVMKDDFTPAQVQTAFDDYFRRMGTAPPAQDLQAFRTRSMERFNASGWESASRRGRTAANDAPRRKYRPR